MKSSDLIGNHTTTLPPGNVPRKSAKASAVIPGGHLARLRSAGEMVTCLQHGMSLRQAIRLSCCFSDRADLIFLSVAVKSFKANQFEFVSQKNSTIISNQAPWSQPSLPFSSVQDRVKLRVRDTDPQDGRRVGGCRVCPAAFWCWLSLSFLTAAGVRENENWGGG